MIIFLVKDCLERPSGGRIATARDCIVAASKLSEKHSIGVLARRSTEFLETFLDFSGTSNSLELKWALVACVHFLRG